MDRLIERIKEHVAIEDIVAETEPLRGRGRYLSGAEHDSLVVDRQEQSYFWNGHIRDGWEDRGDVVDWVGHRRYGRAWDPRDGEMLRPVLQELAGRAGIELHPPTPEEERALRHRQEVGHLLEAATAVYQVHLGQDEGAQAYLRQRGLSAETIQAARLGSTAGGRTLREALRAQGGDLAAAEAAGLLKNGRDFFQGHRIVIPYLKNGRPVYLSSRLIDNSPSDHNEENSERAPKYLHLPLAGLGLAERPLYNEDDLWGRAPIYLVEGVFCALALGQAGYPAVALSGLQLPDSILPRLQDRPVYLCPDADQSGQGAARAQARRIGPQARIAGPPRGKDWNEFLAARGGTPEELAAAFAAARSLLDLLVVEARAAQGSAGAEPALRALFTWIATLPPFAKSLAYKQVHQELGLGARQARALEQAARQEARPGGKDGDTDAEPLIIEGQYPIVHPALDYFGDYAITTVGLMSRPPKGPVERRPYLVVVGSGERQLLAPPKTQAVELEDGVAFLREVPMPMGIATWEYGDLQQFLQGHTPDPPAVFARVRAVFDRYVEFQDAAVPDVLALYTIGSYLHPLFAAYPYIALTGPKASGKSKTMGLLCFMAFNGLPSPDFSDAAIFRTVQAYHATLGIDEGERLANPNDPVSMTARLLLKAGYKAGFPVTRVEKTADGTFVPRCFDVYSPKVLANIRGLEDVLESRCIVVRMLRAVSAKGSLAITADTEDWAQLRHELYSLALTSFPEVRRIYEQDSRCRPFNNRYNELWSPLLAIALFLDPAGRRTYEPVLQYAQRSVELESGQELNEWEELLIIALNALLVAAEEREVSTGDILQRMAAFSDPHDEAPSRSWIGFALRRFGFTERRQTEKGRAYRVRAAQVRELLRRYGVRLPEV